MEKALNSNRRFIAGLTCSMLLTLQIASVCCEGGWSSWTCSSDGTNATRYRQSNVSQGGIETQTTNASTVEWGDWSGWREVVDAECFLYERQRQCNTVNEAIKSNVTCGSCEIGEIGTQRKCAVVQDYSDWSNWSRNTCQGTELVYVRSRVCVSVTPPSVTPTPPIVRLCPSSNNGSNDDYVQTMMSVNHIACPKNEHVALVVCLVIIALACISLGLLFTCLCIREWSKRKTYDIRAAADREKNDNFTEDTFVLKNENVSPEIDISTTERLIACDGGIPPMGKSVEWSCNQRSQAVEEREKENSSPVTPTPEDKGGLPEDPELEQELSVIENSVAVEDTSWF